MYVTEKDDKHTYKEIIVDGRTFYKIIGTLVDSIQTNDNNAQENEKCTSNSNNIEHERINIVENETKLKPFAQNNITTFNYNQDNVIRDGIETHSLQKNFTETIIVDKKNNDTTISDDIKNETNKKSNDETLQDTQVNCANIIEGHSYVKKSCIEPATIFEQQKTCNKLVVNRNLAENTNIINLKEYNDEMDKDIKFKVTGNIDAKTDIENGNYKEKVTETDSIIYNLSTSINKENKLNSIGNNKNDESNHLIINKNIVTKRKISQPFRKRYSDQFKDPAFIKKDLYRKLKMIENFNNKNKDIEELISKYKECISRSIEILKGEFNLPAKEMFKIFKLKEYGFILEDYDSDEEDEINQVEDYE